MIQPAPIKDLPGLTARLRAIVGADGVVSDPEELVVYECDGFTLEKSLPTLVVLPRSTVEVSAVVKLCAAENISIIPRGAGTGLSAATLAMTGGITVALTRMNKVLEVDIRNRRVLVEAGCVNNWVTNAVKSKGFFFAPDPSSQPSCTIGGNIGMNAGGAHTLKYGVTTNHVLGMELVLPDGEVVWLGATPDGGEEPDGYDLRGVVIGAEGMLGIVTRALLRVIRAPMAFKTLLGIFETVEDATQTVSDVIAAGIIPGAMELMDQMITQAVEAACQFGLPLDAGAVLILELDGLPAALPSQAVRVEAIFKKNRAREIRVAKSDQERADLWKARKKAFGAIGRLSPGFLTQDGVVPRSKLPEMMRYVGECGRKYGVRIPNVFHAGDGNIHPLILFDERNPAEVRNALAAGNAILGKCIELGGSVTGEHGIGVEKIHFMPRQYSETDLRAMMTLWRVFDPQSRLNPDKLFPATGRRSIAAPPREEKT